MNPLLRVLVRLYPAWWRQRYGNEFEALLEDVTPGPREFLDIFKGALAMRIKTVGIIPVAGTLIGALAGGIIALQTPELFASSATIRLNSGDDANAQAVAAWLRTSFDQARGVTPETKAATFVKVQRGGTRPTTVTLTYQHTDPVQAQHVARMLADAMTADDRSRAQILAPATLPRAPIGRDYSTAVSTGGGLGFLAGGLIVLVQRFRRRPAQPV
jgi:uncharacterized protein involved in exopolysaccharide biosynthesis